MSYFFPGGQDLIVKPRVRSKYISVRLQPPQTGWRSAVQWTTAETTDPSYIYGGFRDKFRPQAFRLVRKVCRRLKRNNGERDVMGERLRAPDGREEEVTRHTSLRPQRGL